MKKTLITLSVLACISGAALAHPAHAQTVQQGTETVGVTAAKINLSAVGQVCTNSADGTTNDCPTELVCIPDVPGGKGTCQAPTAQTSNAVTGTSLSTDSAAPSSGSSGSFVPLAPIPGLTQGAVANSQGLVNFLQNLYKYLIGLAVVLAIIEIIWGGLEYSMQDSVAKQTDGRNRIQQALFGLVLVLSPVLVFSVINTSILNLSLNIPPLKTMGSGGGGGDTGNPNGGSTTQKDSSGCTVTGVSGVYQTAQCPNSDAASSFVSSCKGSTNMENDTCSSTNGTQTCSVTATCSNTVGPYVFIDVSQGGFSFWGIVNGVSGYSKYEPLATSKANSNNGTQAQQFAAQCTSAGGDTCLDVGATTNDCTYSNQSASQSNTCYQVKLECTKASWFGKISYCSSSPSFTIIN